MKEILLDFGDTVISSITSNGERYVLFTSLGHCWEVYLFHDSYHIKKIF